MAWTTLWRCKRCNHLNSHGTNTCSGCGKDYREGGYQTVYQCQSCGTVVDGSRHTCPGCGR